METFTRYTVHKSDARLTILANVYKRTLQNKNVGESDDLG